ncbi:MAG: Dabb family protein [Clostridia bacterium]|nr:Dabb family protein [Clostridia bacterium]
MVKHIILWTLKADLPNEEKAEIKKGIKEGLEGLSGKIPGLIDIKVETGRLQSSTADLMLDSTFENEEALKAYSVHPLHVDVANNKVRPYTAVRSCLDFEF